MAEPQLSVRSARARDLAHRLATRERRTVAAVVERALEDYDAKHMARQPSAEFFAELARDCAEDVDLDALIHENRRPHSGPDL